MIHAAELGFDFFQRHAGVRPQQRSTAESGSHGWVADHVLDVLLTAELRRFGPQEALSRAAGRQLPKRGHRGQGRERGQSEGERRDGAEGWG